MSAPYNKYLCQPKGHQLNKMPKNRSGFALFLTLTLLAAIGTNVVILSNILKSKRSKSIAFKNDLHAKMNALLALKIALIRLQKNAGKDDVVTAESNSLDNKSHPYKCTGVWDSDKIRFKTWLISSQDPSAAVLKYQDDNIDCFKMPCIPLKNDPCDQSLAYSVSAVDSLKNADVPKMTVLTDTTNGGLKFNLHDLSKDNSNMPSKKISPALGLLRPALELTKTYLNLTPDPNNFCQPRPFGAKTEFVKAGGEEKFPAIPKSQGIHPIILKTLIGANFQYQPSPAEDSCEILDLRVFPIFFLWNPYDVHLSEHQYKFSVSNPLRFIKIDKSLINENTLNSINLNLDLKSAFKPGELKLVSLNSSTANPRSLILKEIKSVKDAKGLVISIRTKEPRIPQEGRMPGNNENHNEGTISINNQRINGSTDINFTNNNDQKFQTIATYNLANKQKEAIQKVSLLYKKNPVPQFYICSEFNEAEKLFGSENSYLAKNPRTLSTVIKTNKKAYQVSNKGNNQTNRLSAGSRRDRRQRSSRANGKSLAPSPFGARNVGEKRIKRRNRFNKAERVSKPSSQINNKSWSSRFLKAEHLRVNKFARKEKILFKTYNPVKASVKNISFLRNVGFNAYEQDASSPFPLTDKAENAPNFQNLARAIWSSAYFASEEDTDYIPLGEKKDTNLHAEKFLLKNNFNLNNLNERDWANFLSAHLGGEEILNSNNKDYSALAKEIVEFIKANQVTEDGKGIVPFRTAADFILPKDDKPCPVQRFANEQKKYAGDILDRIGHLLTTRDDTFVIKFYGDYRKILDGEENAKGIVCERHGEAVVQRMPEHLAINGTEAGERLKKLGRKFKIISFKWTTNKAKL